MMNTSLVSVMPNINFNFSSMAKNEQRYQLMYEQLMAHGCGMPDAELAEHLKLCKAMCQNDKEGSKKSKSQYSDKEIFEAVIAVGKLIPDNLNDIGACIQAVLGEASNTWEDAICALLSELAKRADAMQQDNNGNQMRLDIRKNIKRAINNAQAPCRKEIKGLCKMIGVKYEEINSTEIMDANEKLTCELQEAEDLGITEFKSLKLANDRRQAAIEAHSVISAEKGRDIFYGDQYKDEKHVKDFWQEAREADKKWIEAICAVLNLPYKKSWDNYWPIINCEYVRRQNTNNNLFLFRWALTLLVIGALTDKPVQQPPTNTQNVVTESSKTELLPERS